MRLLDIRASQSEQAHGSGSTAQVCVAQLLCSMRGHTFLQLRQCYLINVQTNCCGGADADIKDERMALRLQVVAQLLAQLLSGLLQAMPSIHETTQQLQLPSISNITHHARSEATQCALPLGKKPIDSAAHSAQT